MAKKASKKAKAPKKTAASKNARKGRNASTSKPSAKRRAAGADPITSPRSQVLPGMKKVRNARLDNICEAIAQERRRKNAAGLEEDSLKQEAQKVMEAARPNIDIYKNAGIELVLVPGASTLRVRLTKETGNESVSGGRLASDDDAEVTEDDTDDDIEDETNDDANDDADGNAARESVGE